MGLNFNVDAWYKSKTSPSSPSISRGKRNSKDISRRRRRARQLSINDIKFLESLGYKVLIK